jgi:hypothetical protein
MIGEEELDELEEKLEIDYQIGEDVEEKVRSVCISPARRSNMTCSLFIDSCQWPVMSASEARFDTGVCLVCRGGIHDEATRNREGVCVLCEGPPGGR